MLESIKCHGNPSYVSDVKCSVSRTYPSFINMESTVRPGIEMNNMDVSQLNELYQRITNSYGDVVWSAGINIGH